MPELLEAGVNNPYASRWTRYQVGRGRLSNGNPHTALENYVAFMELTAQIREAYHETAAAAEREIDRPVDEYRERRRGDRAWVVLGEHLANVGAARPHQQGGCGQRGRSTAEG